MKQNIFYREFVGIEFKGFIQIKYDFYDYLNYHLVDDQYLISYNSVKSELDYENIEYWEIHRNRNFLFFAPSLLLKSDNVNDDTKNLCLERISFIHSLFNFNRIFGLNFERSASDDTEYEIEGIYSRLNIYSKPISLLQFLPLA